MKRLFGHYRLFHLAHVSKAVANRANTLAASPTLHALVLSSFLLPIAFGQGSGSAVKGGLSSGSSGGGASSGLGSEAAIADTVKVAFRERYLLLSTKFKHKGVDFQSKSGMGCIVSTPQGQRILAMPLTMTTPVDVIQGNEKLSVACSMLLAAKVGDLGNSQESLVSFTERVDEIPMEHHPKQARKEPSLDSERRIYRALDERGGVSFNAAPLSSVMKFFMDAYNVPIVINDKSLEGENITPDEPIRLELPAVSFRSALNLILKPLNLTYVIRNEVLQITTYEEAAKGEDPISHWNPVGPELDSERKIFQALSEQGGVSFNATPLSGVMKHFREQHGIPIVIDEKALEGNNITSSEPITLELPPVSLRSALNLILEPCGLTYVIENEVLLITSKAVALAAHPAPFIGANSKGVSAVELNVFGGGLGGGVIGPPAKEFMLAPTQRYSSLQKAKKSDADAGLSNAGGMITATQRREYAAVNGPLAFAVDKTLGIAFMSLPGNFRAVPIPARVKAAGTRFVVLGQGWREITQDLASLAEVLNGSPVIDQQGEPIGMFINQKVVSLPEIAQSLLSVDTKRLGYWGAESMAEVAEVTEAAEQEKNFPTLFSPEPNNGIPELVTPELQKQIERMAALKGKEKEAELNAMQIAFDKRIRLRKAYAEEKQKSVQSKLQRLTELSERMNKQDMEKVAGLLQGPSPASQLDSEVDPFK